MFPIAAITDEISQDLAVAAALVKECGGAALEIRSVWDPGNELWEGKTRAAFPDGYETLKPWVVHLQLKDLRHTSTGKIEAVRFGTGEVDYLGQFRALKAEGYKGYLSLETHWRVRREIPEDLLHRPKGSAFSFGGEEATQLCLQSLQEMLTRLE